MEGRLYFAGAVVVGGFVFFLSEKFKQGGENLHRVDAFYKSRTLDFQSTVNIILIHRLLYAFIGLLCFIFLSNQKRSFTSFFYFKVVFGECLKGFFPKTENFRKKSLPPFILSWVDNLKRS